MECLCFFLYSLFIGCILYSYGVYNERATLPVLYYAIISPLYIYSSIITSITPLLWHNSHLYYDVTKTTSLLWCHESHLSTMMLLTPLLWHTYDYCDFTENICDIFVLGLRLIIQISEIIAFIRYFTSLILLFKFDLAMGKVNQFTQFLFANAAAIF